MLDHLFNVRIKPLSIDVRPIGAFGVTNPPTIVVEVDRGVDARALWVLQLDLALHSAANQRLDFRIQFEP